MSAFFVAGTVALYAAAFMLLCVAMLIVKEIRRR